MIIGLGTSGPNVIEHFHGVEFNPPLTRMREYVDIINMLMAGQPLNYDGKVYKFSRGFTLRFEPPRKHIPILIASLNHKSVEFTAQKADGWMPVMIPLGAAQGLDRGIPRDGGERRARSQSRRGQIAGKDPCHQQSGRARAIQAGTLSFYAARMGTFYAEQLTRFGFGDEVRRIREAWYAGGAKAGTEAVSRRLLDEMGYAGDVRRRDRTARGPGRSRRRPASRGSRCGRPAGFERRSRRWWPIRLNSLPATRRGAIRKVDRTQDSLQGGTR